MQPVARNLGKITRKAINTRGVAWAGLIANWPEIAGPQLRDISRPEKLSWRDGKSAKSDLAKTGGTLVLKVAHGRALEAQYAVPQILDKISTYFGYPAISQVKIVQGDIARPQTHEKTPLPPLDTATQEEIDHQMLNIDNDALKEALARLARGVMATRRA